MSSFISTCQKGIFFSSFQQVFSNWTQVGGRDIDKALHANYQWQVPVFKINKYGFPTHTPPPLPDLFKPSKYFVERADWSLLFLWTHQRNRTHFFNVYWLESFFFSFIQFSYFVHAQSPPLVSIFLELGNFGVKQHA